MKRPTGRISLWGLRTLTSLKPQSFTASARHAQVGAATALSARAVWRFSDKSSVRAVVRVGTSGIEVELGGAQRVSEFSTAGLGVSVGLTVRPPSHTSSFWLSSMSGLCSAGAAASRLALC